MKGITDRQNGKAAAAGDIVINILTALAFIMIAAIVMIRGTEKLAALHEAFSSQRNVMLTFTAAVAVISVIVYVIFGRREREKIGRLTAVCRSVSAGGAITLVGGFILLALGVI